MIPARIEIVPASLRRTGPRGERRHVGHLGPRPALRSVRLKSSGNEPSSGIPAAVGEKSAIGVVRFAQAITSAPGNSPSAATQAADDELRRTPRSASSRVSI